MTKRHNEEWTKKKKELHKQFVVVSRKSRKKKRKRGTESPKNYDVDNVASSSGGTSREQKTVTLKDDKNVKNSLTDTTLSESDKVLDANMSEKESESIRGEQEHEEFSVLKTVTLLAELCESLGILGSALRILIQKVQDLGATTKGVAKLLTDNDNAEVISLASKKLKSLSKSAHGDEREKFLTGSILATKLLEYAAVSSHVDKKPFCGVDVDKVARATLKKDAPEIIQFIKNALAYEGVTDAAVANINEIFMAVSSRHFTMALER